MTPLPDAMIAFIEKYNVLSLCGVKDAISWSANSFYVFDRRTVRFLVVSHRESRHIGMIRQNPFVSGTIAQQTESVVKIQGIQYSGVMTELKKPDSKEAFRLFYKRFPYARLIRSPIWAIIINYLKFTDNTLGFGKKSSWERSDEDRIRVTNPSSGLQE